MPTTRSQSLSAAATGSASGSASPPSLPGAAAPYQENVGRDLSEVGANAPYQTGSFSTATSEDDKMKALQLADSCIIRKNGCLYKLSALAPPDPAQGNDHNMVLNQAESPPAAEEAAVSSFLSDTITSVDEDEPMESDVVVPAETMADLLISADPVPPPVLPTSMETTDEASHPQYVEPKSELPLDSTLHLSDASGADAPSREYIGAVAQHDPPGADAPPNDDVQPSTSSFGSHPGTIFVSLRTEPFPSNPDFVTAAMPLELYGHIPPGGYLSPKYVRRLFPLKFREQPSRRQRLSVVELMRLEHAIAFRRSSQSVIDDPSRGPQAEHSYEDRSIAVRLVVPGWAHRSAYNTVSNFATTRDEITKVDVCVKLGDLPAGTDPLYELISKRQLFGFRSSTSREISAATCGLRPTPPSPLRLLRPSPLGPAPPLKILDWTDLE
ncbi:hypothetical protein OSTOST_04265, partial [Ostertagia ostertagi]